MNTHHLIKNLENKLFILRNKSLVKKVMSLFFMIRILLKKYHLLTFFKILISLVLFYLILKDVRVDDFSKLIRNANIFYAFASLGLTFFISLLFVLRTYILFKPKTKLNFINFYLINRAGNVLSFFLFGGIGQEISRMGYIKDLKKKEIIKISFLDRVLGLLSTLLVLLFTVHLSGSNLFGISISLIKLAISLAFLMLVFVAIFLARISNLDFRKVAISFLISIVYSFGLVLIAYFSFKSVGVYDIFNKLLWVVPTLSLILILPISINGIGVKEFFLKNTLALDSNLVILYSLLTYLIYFILCIPGAGFFVKTKKNSKKI